MKDIEKILESLKNSFKAKNIRYIDIANKTGMAESTIKNLFSRKSDISLSKLLQFSEILNIPLSEILKESENPKKNLYKLTIEQEISLVKDPALLLMMFLSLNHWSFKEILDNYSFEETVVRKLLKKLEGLKLIELDQPGDIIKLLASPNIKWIKNGPIEQYLRKTVLEEFSNIDQANDDFYFKYVPFMASKDTFKTIKKEMGKLNQLIYELVLEDSQNHPPQDRKGYSVILGGRQWVFSAFKDYYSDSGEKN
ncbi:MAG: helix-turn-helix domain-containing protein [Arenicella sp.]